MQPFKFPKDTCSCQNSITQVSSSMSSGHDMQRWRRNKAAAGTGWASTKWSAPENSQYRSTGGGSSGSNEVREDSSRYADRNREAQQQEAKYPPIERALEQQRKAKHPWNRRSPEMTRHQQPEADTEEVTQQRSSGVKEKYNEAQRKIFKYPRKIQELKGETTNRKATQLMKSQEEKNQKILTRRRLDLMPRTMRRTKLKNQQAKREWKKRHSSVRKK